MNTIEYNLKKLVLAQLVEKTKKFFWSKKGKKIPTYKLSNKSIIISPKSSKVSSKIKTIVPIVAASAIGAFLIQRFLAVKETVAPTLMRQTDTFAQAGAKVAETAANSDLHEAVFNSSLQGIGLWFLFGALFAVLLILIINWRKL